LIQSLLLFCTYQLAQWESQFLPSLVPLLAPQAKAPSETIQQPANHISITLVQYKYCFYTYIEIKWYLPTSM